MTLLNGAPEPIIYEGTSLLDSNGSDDDDGMHSPHHLSSEVIERTGVIFQPDFHGNVEVIEQNSDRSSSVRKNRISFCRQTSSSSTNSSSTRHSRNSKSKIIIDASGVTSTANGSMGNNDTALMIGTITTTSILNLVVATAGGIGMVTLPGSFAQLGWTEGFGLLIIAATAAAASLFFLDWACKAIVSKQSENGHRHNSHSMDAATTSSYAGLVAHTLGHPGSQTLEFLTLTYCLGQVIAYLGAIGGQVVSLLSLVGILDWTIHECICGVALIVIFPLSLLPEAGAMRFAGFLGTICMIYIAGAVVLGDGIGALKGGGMCSLSDSAAAAVDDDGDGGGMGSYTTLLKNAPIFLFSMNASVTYVPVRYQHQTCLGELLVGGTLSTSRIVKRESTTMIWTAILVAGFFYAVCSGVAYMAYCDQVPENVVDVWPLTWIPGSLARFFLAIELTMAAAGIYVPLGRAAFWHLLFGPFEKVAAKGTTRTIVTLAFVAVSAFGSILLGGALALPLSITSALCVTAQMFVLPGLCVSTLLPGSRIRNRIPGGRMTALGFALFGGIFGILSLAALFGLMG